MGLTLHQGHGHSHGGGGGGGHGHSHDDGESAGDRQNVNVKAAFVHVVGDFLSSLGVLIAALIIYFKPEYKLADPICTFIFSVLVLFTTVRILQETMNVLMEGETCVLYFYYYSVFLETAMNYLLTKNPWGSSMTDQRTPSLFYGCRRLRVF